MNQNRVREALIRIIGINDAQPILERAAEENFVHNIATELEKTFGPVAARKVMIQMVDELTRSEPSAARIVERLLVKETGQT